MFPPAHSQQQAMGNSPPKLTPKEQLKLYQKDLRKAMRSLEREQRELETQQKKLATEIRKAAKEGKTVSAAA
jgi:hypothetical protein